MQICSKISGMELVLKISNRIGREGWEMLTRALQLHQPDMKIMIKISKSVLDEDRLEDLRGFWTALWPAATWCVSSHISCLGMVLHNEDSPLLEDSLRLELEEIMDMSHDEWVGMD